MRSVALSVVLALALSSASYAAGVDMRTGSFDGQWCNYLARFDIDRRDPGGAWIFEGKVLIKATGQYDPIWIEQYADNSLRMIRYLQGANYGLTQVVQTNPPYEVFINDVLFTVFESIDNNFGLGCTAGVVPTGLATRLYMP